MRPGLFPRVVRRTTTPEQDAEIVRMYRSGKSPRHVAMLLGLPQELVRHRCREAGGAPRNPWSNR